MTPRLLAGELSIPTYPDFQISFLIPSFVECQCGITNCLCILQCVGDLVVMMSALHAECRGFEPRPAYDFHYVFPIKNTELSKKLTFIPL
jgi:hypothetical protein